MNAGTRVTVPGSSVRATVPGAGVRATGPGVRAGVNVPGASVRGTVPGSSVRATVPGAGVRATVPGVNAGANVPGASVRADVPGADVRAGVPGTDARVDVPGADVRADIDGRAGVGARVDAGADVRGRVTADQLDTHLNLRTDRGAIGVDGRAAANIGTNVDVGLRPSWLDVRASNLARIDTNLNAAVRTPRIRAQAMSNWLDNNPARADHWGQWGAGVRSRWQPGWHHGYFNDHYWATHRAPYPWRRWAYWYGGHPWSYWWTYPTWGAYVAWWPHWGWRAPYYYDYGPGGNVVYSNGYVYVSGQPVATEADYAASAAALATVEPPANPDVATEWLPLGTFALATSREDRETNRVIQLAVDKDGIVSGTLIDRETDETFAVQGRVDRQTQRMAFTIGDNQDLVYETGVYNLTQAETPILVHGGPDSRATQLLIRLEAPEAEQPEKQAPPPPAPGLEQ